MPDARPQFNKTLQRVKLQSTLDSVMNLADQNTTTSTRTLKLVSKLFDKKIKDLKNDPLDDFLVKQSQLNKELNDLVAVINQFTEGLENLKQQSPTVQEFLETVNAAEIEENASNFIIKMDKLALNDSNGHSDGTLVVNPLKWEPEAPKIPKDRPLQGSIAYINSPSDFYVHPYAGVEEFLMTVQQEQAKLIQKGMTCFAKIEEGMYCAARFHEDFYWYRAKIVGVTHPKGNLDEIEKVKVFYIDYGNTAETTPGDIMPLAASLSSQKLMAVNCHFVHFDPENGWPAEATQAMAEKVANGNIQIYFNKPSPRISDVGTFPFFPVDLYLKDTNQKVFEAIRKFASTA